MNRPQHPPRSPGRPGPTLSTGSQARPEKPLPKISAPLGRSSTAAGAANDRRDEKDRNDRKISPKSNLKPKPGRKQSAEPADPEAGESKGMGSLMVSLLLHGAIVTMAILWVAKEAFTPEAVPDFKPPSKRVMLPAQIRQQALSNARHDAAAPRPSYSKHMASKAPGPVAVPAMPDVDLKQMLPLDPSELVSDQISGMIGASGYGTGTGRGLGGGGGTGKGSGMAFFNIRDTAKSVVIMIDVSQSMFSRTGDYDSHTRQLLKHGAEQSFDAIRREAITLINSLGPDTRFGIIRWSGSARSWKPELVRATDENKRQAKEHIITEIDANTAPPTGGRPGGTRHDYAIEELLRLAPETAFMLTDGNATASQPGGGMTTIPADTLLDQLTAAAKSKEALPRINTIYYLTGADKKEEEDMLKAIARKTKGKFRKMEAPTAKPDSGKKGKPDSRKRD